MTTTNAHRFAHGRSPMGNVLPGGFCTARGCGWHGTPAEFVKHLYDLTPKIGDDRSWRFHRRQRGLPS